jgi:hypothetical protein
MKSPLTNDERPSTAMLISAVPPPFVPASACAPPLDWVG